MRPNNKDKTTREKVFIFQGERYSYISRFSKRRFAPISFRIDPSTPSQKFSVRSSRYSTKGSPLHFFYPWLAFTQFLSRFNALVQQGTERRGEIYTMFLCTCPIGLVTLHRWAQNGWSIENCRGIASVPVNARPTNTWLSVARGRGWSVKSKFRCWLRSSDTVPQITF